MRGNLTLKGAAMWPTPNTRDRGKDGPGRQGGPSLNAALVGGQLSPTWVELLMGFPPGWTELASTNPTVL
jgi:hypothetical protein